jgi:GT2 family glycosyltransferase
MPEKPRVSVIVLGYNEKRFLDGCLASVLDQDYPREQYEVLFVDNGSSDGSLEWVEEHFPEVKAIRLEQNYGFGGGNNRGAEQARGDLVAFLNADTVAHRGWLSGLVQAMDDDPQVKACVAGGLAPNYPGFELQEREAMPSHVYYSDVVRFGHVGTNRIRVNGSPREILHLAGSTAMVDLSALDELEYIFDESYFLDGDDMDLGFRINALGYKAVVQPKALFYHLAGGSTILEPSRRVLQRMVRLHRNRFTTYYRNMHNVEFLLALPVLLFGAPLKPFAFEMPLGRKLVYALVIVPVSWYSLAKAAVTRFPQHAERRRRILQRRRRESLWFLKQILTRRQYKE